LGTAERLVAANPWRMTILANGPDRECVAVEI
jgi:hypothetical protein